MKVDHDILQLNLVTAGALTHVTFRHDQLSIHTMHLKSLNLLVHVFLLETEKKKSFAGRWKLSVTFIDTFIISLRVFFIFHFAVQVIFIINVVIVVVIFFTLPGVVQFLLFSHHVQTWNVSVGSVSWSVTIWLFLLGKNTTRLFRPNCELPKNFLPFSLLFFQIDPSCNCWCWVKGFHHWAKHWTTVTDRGIWMFT